MILILISISTIFYTLSVLADKPHSDLEYNINVDMNNNQKYWGYIEEIQYKAVLKNGGSLNINLNTKSNNPLDVTEIRLYNVCNQGDKVEIPEPFGDSGL